jgi:phospholipid-binding lipoprotein MlaA
MLQRGCFIPIVLIAVTAVGLWTGGVFGQDNPETRAPYLTQVPEPPTYLPSVDRASHSTELPSAPGQAQTKIIAPQVQPEVKQAESSAASASPHSDQVSPPDPLAPVNRKVLDVNEKLDRTAVHPVASMWATVMPKPARHCISRFFDNAKFIPRFTNALFQLKMKDAGGELARFGINSTLGVAGLFDPADKWFGIKEHDNDFGTTLKVWGMPDGWFVMMPVGGPVNVRDTLGHFVDGAMNPMNYLVPASGELYETLAHSIDGLNDRSNDLDKFEGVPLQASTHEPMSNSRGLYETVRANYLQRDGQKPADHGGGVAAATAGAATTAAAAAGAKQSQSAAIGTASQGAAYVGR